MGKAGYKDHFENTVRNFDRINRQNKTKDVALEMLPLAEQIKIAEKRDAADLVEKEKAARIKADKKEEVRFTGLALGTASRIEYEKEVKAEQVAVAEKVAAEEKKVKEAAKAAKASK